MKILLMHNYYQMSGGEDTVVASEKALLETYGHEVALYSVINDHIKGVIEKIKTALQTSYSRTSKIAVAKYLKQFRPDVVHVHNLFPCITPSVYDACNEAGIPVVQTLHNYRFICCGALLLRRGRICEDCLTCSPYKAIRFACYRKSYLGTLVVAHMITSHKKRTWHNKVDCFIALTEFAKSKYIAAGFPSDKIVMKPNYVSSKKSHKISGSRKGALFVGRLAPEKGIMTLLRAWTDISQHLKIIGDGPLLKDARSYQNVNIVFEGHKPSKSVQESMENAQFLIMPSLWYEGFPMVLVEAFASSLPVIVSRLGSMAEIVEDGLTGLHFRAGDADDLAAKVRWAFEHPKEMHQMGLRARELYEKKYTAEGNYSQLMTIYNSVISSNCL